MSVNKKKISVPTRIINWFSNVSYFLACVAMVLVLLSMTYEVVMRHVFNRPTIWSFEICGYLFMAIVTLSGARILREDGHIKMDFIKNLMSVRMTAINSLFAGVLGVIFCAVVVWKGGEYTWTAFSYNYRASTVLRSPLWPVLFLLPLGFSLMGLIFLVRIREDIKILRKGVVAPESDKPGNIAQEESEA